MEQNCKNSSVIFILPIAFCLLFPSALSTTDCLFLTVDCCLFVKSDNLLEQHWLHCYTTAGLTTVPGSKSCVFYNQQTMCACEAVQILPNDKLQSKYVRLALSIKRLPVNMNGRCCSKHYTLFCGLFVAVGIVRLIFFLRVRQ